MTIGKTMDVYYFNLHLWPADRA